MSADAIGTNEHTDTPQTNSKIHRFFYMILFIIIFALIEAILALAAIFMFITNTVLGRENRTVSDFGDVLAEYLKQITRYQTQSTNHIPWPIGDWPSGKEEV